MTGFFEKSPGNRSMMRLLAFLGFILGTLVATWGLVLLTIVVMRVVNGSDPTTAQLVGSLILLVSGGLALAGGGEALKVVQQRSEVRERQIIRTSDGGVEIDETVDVESGGSIGSDPPARNGL